MPDHAKSTCRNTIVLKITAFNSEKEKKKNYKKKRSLFQGEVMATRRAKLQIKPKVRIRSSAKAAVNESKEKAVASENDKFTPKSEDTIRSNVTAASVSTAKPKEVTKSDSNADVDNVNSDVNLSATNLKDDNENSVEVAPKSPTKIMEPSTQSRIVSRSRLPKAKPNIGEIERRGRIRSSYSESEDESTRQRNPSGPPSLQRVLRLDENANKGSPCLTALLNKEITAVEAPRNDKVILTDQASSRKRHRSAAHEVDDLKKQRKDFYRKGNKPPEKSKMRMLDLIFYNPSSSPMKNSEEVSVSISDQNNDVKQNSNTSRPEEVEIDDPVAIDEEIDGTNDEVDDENMMPVPQVKLGPDGNIIVDEETLVVKPLKVNPEAVNKNPVLYESTSMTTYSSFRRRQSQGKWNDLETSKFYKALCTVGTDFSLMAQLFPNRSRRELKKKFMKEDRLHKDLVTRALNDNEFYDIEFFEKNIKECEENENRRKKTKPALLKKPKAGKRKYSRRKPTYDWSDSDDDKLDAVNIDADDCVEVDPKDPDWRRPSGDAESTIQNVQRKSKRQHKQHIPLSSTEPKQPDYSKSEPEPSVNTVHVPLNNITESITLPSPSVDVALPANYVQSPTMPAQLFLVAEDSPNQKEKIIHVYMVSPASNGAIGTSAGPSTLPLVLSPNLAGISLLNQPLQETSHGQQVNGHLMNVPPATVTSVPVQSSDCLSNI